MKCDGVGTPGGAVAAGTLTGYTGEATESALDALFEGTFSPLIGTLRRPVVATLVGALFSPLVGALRSPGVDPPDVSSESPIEGAFDIVTGDTTEGTDVVVVLEGMD